MKKCIMMLLTVFVLVGWGFSAGAYQLSYMYVSHRIYEDGRDFNRMLFTVVDDSGAFPTSNVVKSVTLLDPEGKPVSLSEIQFYYNANYFYCTYNNNTGQFNYQQAPDSAYSADFAGTLIQGAYTLNVEDVNGATLTKTFQFNGLVTLPIIPASSINCYKDNGGNLILSWEKPVIPAGLDINNTNTTGGLDAFTNGKGTGEVWVRVPTDLGFISIPDSVIQQFKGWGYSYKFMVMFRTNDTNNRAYSNWVEIDLDGGRLRWSNIADLGNNWKWSDWFGYFNDRVSPWIYHEQHGWLYTFGNSVDGLTFWDPEMDGFWWTSESTYPYLYRFSDAAWLFYQEGSVDPRWFYNYKTSKWESVGD